jgi:hypothetical protein
VNQETEKAQDKPALNAESFQRLLSAAYMLQVHSERQRSFQPLGSDRKSLFAAGAIVQKRTPSIRLVPPVEHGVPHRTIILLRKPTFWRMVEALTIGTIFCAMMGLSIHRLSALPGGTSLLADMPGQGSAVQAARSTAQVLGSLPQPGIARNSRQLAVAREGDGEGGSVAEDVVVVRYPESAANLPGEAARNTTSGSVQGQPSPTKNTTPKPHLRPTFGRDEDMLAADTVVQYGDDVTMWSGNTKRAGLDRLGR